MTDEQAQAYVMRVADELGLLRALDAEPYREIPGILQVAIARYGAWERARGAASRGCERHTKTGTCIDKGYMAPCWGCQQQAALAAAEKAMQEGATA